MSAPSTRTVYRVLVVVDSAYTEHTEDWFATATEAFLYARAADGAHVEDVEVNRCVLKPRLTRMQLLNRASIVESSHVVPPEQWKRVLRRASRRGA